MADLVEGQWRATAGGGYRLASAAARPDPAEAEEQFIARVDSARRSDCGTMREIRAGRLSEYRQALPLTEGEVLAAYQKEDAWLCADVLHPAGRGLLGLLACLGPRQLDELLTEGKLGMPLADLPLSLRRHLGDWARGRWGWPGGTSEPLNPDLPLRFDDPRERWSNSVVILTWVGDVLQLQLAVPDVYTFRARIVHLATAPEAEARQKLVALGVQEIGGAATAASRSATMQWSPGVSADELQPVRSATGPDLARPVDLTSLAGKRIPLSDLLAQVAAQADLAVLAVAAPAEVRVPIPSGPRLPTSVGQALVLIAAAPGPPRSPQVADGWLVLREAGIELLPWADPPGTLVREWQARVKRSRTVPLPDLAALSVALNPLQLDRFTDQVRELRDAPLGDLRLYGGLSAEQRAALLRGETVAVASLSAQERQALLRRARASHPWFTQGHLAPAVLRILPETLCTEEPGVAVLIEYRRPESPRDREILFAAALEFRLPDAHGAGR